MPKLVGSQKIREYLGCSESTFMQRVVSEELPVKMVKGQYEATTKNLDKWLGVQEKTKKQLEAEAKKDADAADKERTEADEAEAKAEKERLEAEAAEEKAAESKKKADNAK